MSRFEIKNKKELERLRQKLVCAYSVDSMEHEGPTTKVCRGQMAESHSCPQIKCMGKNDGCSQIWFREIWPYGAAISFEEWAIAVQKRECYGCPACISDNYHINKRPWCFKCGADIIVSEHAEVFNEYLPTVLGLITTPFRVKDLGVHKWEMACFENKEHETGYFFYDDNGHIKDLKGKERLKITGF